MFDDESINKGEVRKVKVILVSGKAQNGKDTVASMLQSRLKQDGHKVLITHYGDLVKYICHSYFGWNGEKDIEGRHLLQYVGTDVIRKQNPMFWVDFVTKMLEYFYENWDYVIIPDCRFPNEIEYVKEKGFITTHLRVIRDNFVSPLTAEQQNHASETSLDNVEPDYYIYNNGSIEELNEKVTKWIEENMYDNKK